ncbi:MAG TPA: transcriptional repressor [Candidatus Saccharimonadales bacterium]|nr:transcriptional repressor [Candidatus Saccharimonadales bacterium]
METSLVKLVQTLKESNASVTKARREVFVCLLNSGPLSVGQLARHLQPKLDRATVYRTVELFEKLGVVNRIWRGFKNQIELSEIFTPHHHHALCQSCGRTLDITSSELESTLANLGKKHHFLTLSHSVELLGYCDHCQKGN